MNKSYNNLDLTLKTNSCKHELYNYTSIYKLSYINYKIKSFCFNLIIGIPYNITCIFKVKYFYKKRY